MSTTISGTNGVTFPDSTSMQTGQQACKAWVNFNGTGTVAIRESYNVSTITDNGTGDYTVNFTTAMPDANYVFSGNTLHIVGGTNYLRGWQPILTPTTTALRINNSVLNSGSLEDSQSISVAVFSN